MLVVLLSFTPSTSFPCLLPFAFCLLCFVSFFFFVYSPGSCYLLSSLHNFFKYKYNVTLFVCFYYSFCIQSDVVISWADCLIQLDPFFILKIKLRNKQKKKTNPLLASFILYKKFYFDFCWSIETKFCSTPEC